MSANDRFRIDTSAGFSLVELVAYMAVMVTLAAFVLPFTRSTINAHNLTGDARNIASSISLAKMRAAASFTKARVFVDLSGGTFRVERWLKNTNTWTIEGIEKQLSATVSFGFAGIAAPPPNTQGVIGQAPVCLNAAGVAIANTACVVFNSRGIPVDNAGAPTAIDAYYVGDGSTVFGVTVSTGGLIQLWRSNVGAGAWVLN